MDTLFLIGRIMFGGFFLMMGAMHFMKAKSFAEYAKMKGVPMPGLGNVVAGLMILLGGLGVVLGVYTQISLWLIIIFLVLTALKMHTFWKETDATTKMIEMTQFTKNIALAGAGLMMLMLPLPWPLVV